MILNDLCHILWIRFGFDRCVMVCGEIGYTRYTTKVAILVNLNVEKNYEKVDPGVPYLFYFQSNLFNWENDVVSERRLTAQIKEGAQV